jgi:HSP20 family protein
MLSRFDDFDRTSAIDQLRRHMERLFEDFEPAEVPARGDAERMWTGRFPRLSFTEHESSFVLETDLPGLGEKDVQLTIHQDVLTLSGERKPDAPQGWFVHRQERRPVKFSRSFALPCKVDPERSTATLKNGVLTVTLVKMAEAKPRAIAVQAQ